MFALRYMSLVYVTEKEILILQLYYFYSMDSNVFVEMFCEKIENERKVIAKSHAQEINDRYVEVHGGSLFIQVTCCLYIFPLSIHHILLYNEMMIFIKLPCQIRF